MVEPRPPLPRRRSALASVLAGAVVVAGGLAIGLVEAFRLPKGSLWGVVGVVIVLIVAIRTLARPR
jgi:uncharacterized BrkB/YihY/UPF0761 family membrane protein